MEKDIQKIFDYLEDYLRLWNWDIEFEFEDGLIDDGLAAHVKKRDYAHMHAIIHIDPKLKNYMDTGATGIKYIIKILLHELLHLFTGPATEIIGKHDALDSNLGENIRILLYNHAQDIEEIQTVILEKIIYEEIEKKKDFKDLVNIIKKQPGKQRK